MNDESNRLNGDINESNLSLKEKSEWQKIRWKNRRRMAWISIATLVFIVLLFFFAPISNERLQIIADPIAMVSFVFGGVIGAYMGFTSFEKWKMGK